MNQTLFPAIPLDKRCQILEYNNLGIFAINKASGVLSHPNSKSHGKSHTLLKAKYNTDDECYEWDDDEKQKRRFYLCHRLDSPTSGIIIGASTKEIAAIIKGKFAKREIQKTYLAITQLNPRVKEGLWSDRLREEKIDGKLRVVRGSGLPCQCKVRFIRNKKGSMNLNLIEMQPLTGRTHQLRVQCQVRKMPIVGDKTYGNFSLNRKIKKDSKLERLCLHASEIKFSIQYNHKEVIFNAESPLPRILGKIMS